MKAKHGSGSMRHARTGWHAAFSALLVTALAFSGTPAQALQAMRDTQNAQEAPPAQSSAQEPDSTAPPTIAEISATPADAETHASPVIESNPPSERTNPTPDPALDPAHEPEPKPNPSPTPAPSNAPVISLTGIYNSIAAPNVLYQFIQPRMRVEVDHTPADTSEYRVAVKSVVTPAGGTYTFAEGDTAFTPQTTDGGKTYHVTYGVQHSEDGITWRWVDNVEERCAISVHHTGGRTEIDGDLARVASLEVDVTDGTPTWDANDNPGNDSGPNNGVVRSYDTLTYDLKYQTQTKNSEPIGHGRLYFEADLPLGSGQAIFDTDAMGTMDTTLGFGWQLDTTSTPGHQILKWFYEINETTDKSGNTVGSFPGQGTFPVHVRVLAAANGTIVHPTFRASVAYVENGETKTNGSYDVPASAQPNHVRVSAAPSYNVQLGAPAGSFFKVGSYDFSTGNDQALDRQAGTVFGRLQGYTATIQLYNASVDKGLKGIELPQGDITFTVDLASVFKGTDGHTHHVQSPLVWSYGPNAANAFPDERIAHPNPLCYTNGPEDLKRSDEHIRAPRTRTTGVWNGGDWHAERSGDTITFTVKNYIVNPSWYPSDDSDMSPEESRYYDPATGVRNIGCFSVGKLWLVVPFGGSTDRSDPQYYANLYGDGSLQVTVSDANMSATSATGQRVTNDDQANKTDDLLMHTVQLTPDGSYTAYGHYSLNGDPSNISQGLDGLVGTGDYLSGTDSQSIGGKLGIRWGAFVHANEPDAALRAANSLMKFDSEALEIDGPPAPFSAVAHDGYKATYLYAAKPDGTGWNSDDEMNRAREEDLVYYPSLDALRAASKTCVGILTEIRAGSHLPFNSNDYASSIPMRVKNDPAIAGKVYQMTSTQNLWFKSAYEAVIASRGAFPSRLDLAPGERVATNHRGRAHETGISTYRKASYGESGFTAGGGGEPHHGDSLYVVEHKAEITLNVEQKDAAGNERMNYDLSQDQSTVDYIMRPSINFSEGITPPSSATTTLTITSTLPEGLTYRRHSAIMGGEYHEGKTPGQAGTVVGGRPLEPTVTPQENGSALLTWTIPNVPIDGDPEPIRYKADIEKATVSGTALLDTATIHTAEDRRPFKSENGNLATATVRVSAPASLVVNVAADAMFCDQETPMGYKLRWTNNSTSDYAQKALMGTLPANGDASGSRFSGSWTIDGSLRLGLPAASDANDYSFWYTTDDASVLDASKVNPSDLVGNSAMSGDVKWIRATIDGDANVTDLNGKTPTAFLVVGPLKTFESAAAHVRLRPQGNHPGDTYRCRSSIDMSSVTDTVRVPERMIAGLVWEDTDKDGKRASTERRMGGIEVRLETRGADGSWTQAHHVDGTPVAPVMTDDDTGEYGFGDLQAGKYRIVFANGGAPLGGYKATTRNAAGVDDALNSDAEPTYGQNGILVSARIDGVHLPSAADMTHSPYVLGFLDLGLVQHNPPASDIESVEPIPGKTMVTPPSENMPRPPCIIPPSTLVPPSGTTPSTGVTPRPGIVFPPCPAPKAEQEKAKPTQDAAVNIIGRVWEIPQTGDASSGMAAGLALLGAGALAASRRRNREDRAA